MAEENDVKSTQAEPIDLTLVKNGGVLKEIITEGTTDEFPSEGCKVFVHYTGRLLDGTKFDSSVDRNEKFSFDLGKGQVIKAWDLGVASMKKGEKCKLTCQPEFAYGVKGSPPSIPPDSTLVFEIELFDWEFENVSEGVTRQIIKEGEMYDTPNDGASVDIHIKGMHGDRIFDERSLKFNLNEDEAENIPKAVENAIKKMKKGEMSLFQVSSKYAWGDGNEALGVPKDADVKYEIHLKSFEKAKESWELNDEEKIDQSEIVKSKGTNFFKAGKYKRAVAQYKRITDYLDNREDEKKTEFDEKWNSLKLAAHLNLALCYIKLKEFDEAVKSCTAAIDVNGTSEKAFFRRGEAHFYTANYAEAKADFNRARSLNPENKLAAKKIQDCNTQIKKQQEKERKTFAGMFDKFAKQDEKDEIRQKKVVKDAKRAKAEETDQDAASGDAKVENGEMEVETPEPEQAKVNGD